MVQMVLGRKSVVFGHGLRGGAIHRFRALRALQDLWQAHPGITSDAAFRFELAVSPGAQ